MPLEKLQFTPNVPVEVALRFTEGKIVEGRFGDQVYFTLAHPANTCMYLDLGVAQKINALEPQKNERFQVCKRHSGKKGDPIQWDVWRPEPGQRRPVKPSAAEATGIDETDIEAEVRREVEARKAKQQIANQPGAGVPPPAPAQTAATQPSIVVNGNGSTNGHGTNGNGRATPPPYAASGIPAKIPTKIPMNVAFNEALDWMRAGLESHHIQWSDAAQQDLVSTVLIGGLREGWIAPWERNLNKTYQEVQ